MQETGHPSATIVVGAIAIISGITGLSLNSVHMVLGIILEVLSILSVTMVVIINWEAALSKLKDIFSKKKEQ